ncbi:hypothetical protein PENSPDRAFT_379183 [Peniophora sp. CONT]|nr:hypothetical protein PENSPDRAFT_379183 [Peniophora sp. CONT]
MAGLAPLNDDIPGHQVPGPANAIDDGPLPFDIVLHAGLPDQAAVQNAGFTPQNNLPALDVVQEEFVPDVAPMQQGPEGANALQIDFGHDGENEADPDVDPNHWPVALNAVVEVMGFLQDDHPVFAAHPDGPGLVMELHTALTQYMLAHGLPVNHPVQPIALPQNLPPLDGFVDLVGLDNLDVGPHHGPDVQEDDFADFGEPPEDDEIDWEEQVGQVDQVVDEVGDGHALLLQPVPLPDVEPVLQPALVPGHDYVPIPAPAQDAAAVAQDDAEDGAHMNQQEDAPPAYDAPHAAPVEDGEDEAEGPEHDPDIEGADLAVEIPPVAPEQMVQDVGHPDNELAQDDPNVAQQDDIRAPSVDAHRTVEEVSIPGPSHLSVGLDVSALFTDQGRQALSYLCTRFSLNEGTHCLNDAVVEAANALQNLDHSGAHRQPVLAPGPSTVGTTSIAINGPPEKEERHDRIRKLRNTWRKAFSGLTSRRSPSQPTGVPLQGY